MKQKLFIVLSIFLSMMFLAGCQNNQASTDKVEIKQITISDLEKMLENNEKGKMYLDVREVDEYADGHIKRFMNFPLSTLEETIGKLSKEEEIVIVCRSGNRSMQAANFLTNNGFPHVTNVQGGMLEWRQDVVSGNE